MLMIVIYPIDTKFMKTNYILKSLFTFFLGIFPLVIILTLFMKFSHSQLSLSLCLPFVDPSNSIMMVKVIAWCVAIIQIRASIIIPIAHYIMLKHLTKSQESIKQFKSEKVSNKSLIAQIFTITLSNIICWVPTNVIYLMALFLTRYPTELVIWTTVAVTPLNSILNPIVFIITTIKRIIKDKL